MNREIFFTLDEPTILLNKLLRMHWAARRKRIKALAWEIRAKARPPGKPFQRCEIHVKRYSTGRLPDDDGLRGGLKHLLDCLVVNTKVNPHGGGYIKSDEPSCILKTEALAFHVKHRADQRTEITIREVE